MIYLVGGAPRSGKSVLGQRVAQQLNVGWVARAWQRRSAF
ncbi:MAG: hypothetical protein RL033_756 [Pseudomonadota bacterium]|jgi:shikimate kinase